MKVTLNVEYEAGADPNVEASKKDKFLRRIYGVGKWGRKNNNLEVIL